MTLRSALAWLQASHIATITGESTLLTGLLSAIHLVGLTLLVGGAVVSSLRLLGVVLQERPAHEITAAAGRGMSIGLAVSIGSGLLLFAPRALATYRNSIFQFKMFMLFSAAMFHFTFGRRIAERIDAGPQLLKVTGAFELVLWFGVALSGCAFIFLE